jgi:hypothetical protein
MVRQRLSPGPSPICESEHSAEVANELLEVGYARFAVLVVTADDFDARSGTGQLEKPPPRHHLDRRHTKHQPRLAHSGHRLRVLAGDRDAGGGPETPDRRDENGRRGTQPLNLGAGNCESPAPASSHTHAATVATIAVDNYSTALPAQCAVRATQQAGRAGDSSRAAVLSPSCDETACRVDPIQQRSTRHSTSRQAGSLLHRRLEVGPDNARYGGAQKSDGLLEGNLLSAAIGGLQVDDDRPSSRHTGSSQVCEQLPPSLRGCPAADDDTARLSRCKCLD